MSELTSDHREKLMSDLRTVIFRRRRGAEGSPPTRPPLAPPELRVRMQERLKQAKVRLQDLQDTRRGARPALLAMRPTTMCTIILGRPSVPRPASA